jgi:hypothetical protein
MTDLDKAKDYVKNTIQNVELTFLAIEDKRLQSTKFPFYDGGLTPLILFYNQKYKFPFKAPKHITDIKGNTLLEICNNFYANYNFKPNLDYESDLFNDVNKNYYFYNKKNDFDLVMSEFKSVYESKTIDVFNVFEWVNNISNVILSLIAVTERPSLGIFDGDIKTKLFNYNNYLFTIIETMLKETPERLNYYYLPTFCFYQLLCKIINRKSDIIKNTGGELILQLFKLMTPNKIINFPETTENDNYLLNWLSYFIIKDYFDDYTDHFFKTYTLKQITTVIVLKESFKLIEVFENSSKNNLTKNIKNEKMRKHSGHRKKNQKNNIYNVENLNEDSYSKDNTELEHFEGEQKIDKIKEKLGDTKKNVKPMWKILLYWMIFGIFLYIACRGIIFFWSIVYNFFSK